jgi:hypothetical protein
MTTVDGRGFVQHKRTATGAPHEHQIQASDGRYSQYQGYCWSQIVVPHNTQLLELANCHINVEFSFTVNVIPYLYKYIFKGPDHVQVSVHSKTDEIQNYVYSRYICASEATWRILGYQIHPRRYPAVGTLPVHVEGRAYVTFIPEETEPPPGEGSAVQTRSQTVAADRHVLSNSKLEQYLMRPAFHLNKKKKKIELHAMLYVDLYNAYDFVTQCTNRKPHNTQAITDLHIYERTGRKIHRMWVKRPSAGEDYYLRLLLGNFPSPIVPDHIVDEVRLLGNGNDGVLQWAWNALKHGCDSFQERARQGGLLADQNEYTQCFTDAIRVQMITGRHARQLFVTVIFEGASSVVLWETFGVPDSVPLDGMAGEARPLFSDFHADLIEKGNQASSETTHRARQMALVDIAHRLEYYNKTLDQFGLPVPVDTESELARAKRAYTSPTGTAPNPQRQELERSFFEDTVPQLNSTGGDEQRALFYHLVTAVMTCTPIQMYLGGKSGRGKTWLINAVTAYLRLQGKVVLCCASTGIASINHAFGYTAHNLFKIPVETDEVDTRIGLSCNVEGGTSRGDLIAGADLIIWDEFAMSNKRDVQGVSELCQDLRRNHTQLFGGVSFVGIGDVHQIPPVIPYANDDQVVAASVVSWAGWARLERFELKYPHRDGLDLAHSRFVDSCGTGHLSTASTDQGNVSAGYSRLQGLAVASNVDALIEHVYPLGDGANALEDACRAILTCRNKDVDEINELIAEKRLPSPWVELYSSDEMQDQDPQDPLNMFGADFLNMLENPGQYPPHKLRLKVGAKVMVMRNLSAVDQLMNGTMGVIKHIRKFMVLLETATGTHVIPRINFTINIKRCNYTVNRRQFPLRLAYCKTINKSQGSTMTCLGLDLRHHPFSHGQLYVAVGRSRNSRSVAVLVGPDMLDEDKTALTVNVVLDTLLTLCRCNAPLDVLPHPPHFDRQAQLPYRPGQRAGPVTTRADVAMPDAVPISQVAAPSGEDTMDDAGWEPQLVRAATPAAPHGDSTIAECPNSDEGI